MQKGIQARGGFPLPQPGTVTINGQAQKYLDFITEHQLTDPALWRLFVSAFETAADADDLGWRGEYWGKMMRGGCLVYRCTGDKRLYTVLQSAVEALLAAAQEDGRISSYPREKDYMSWDLWCRKYVLTGMLHFYDICTDATLKTRIVSAMEKHADCIIKGVGDGEGQIPITETAEIWLGVNSCSILEPMVDLYLHTGEPRFLAFAKYIVNTGGCRGGNLIDLALEDRLLPSEYPEVKAYETMSFFEGVLAYANAAGEPDLVTAVLRFAEKVRLNEITLIGCAGCTHELFDRAAVRQTEYSETIMQETCVTVTWMRLCAKLFAKTGSDVWAAEVERSALNALYGSVNLYGQPIEDLCGAGALQGLVFDSYSPLYMNRRGRGVGGLRFFADGAYYGCCVCIGAAGLAVYPLVEALRTKKDAPCTLREHLLNGKRAFTWGPLALARDGAKEPGDIAAPVRPVYGDGGALRYTLEPCAPGEQLRLRLETETGPVLLTDYASCGKRWAEQSAPITVWMNG